MFRSNVSFIVEELLQDGMLLEERPLHSGRGRVPTHLRLNDDAYPVLGVYIQPSRVRVVHAGLQGRLKQRWLFDMVQEPGYFVLTLGRVIEKIRQELGINHFKRLGIAFPGFVNAETGQIIWSPELTQFSGYSLGEQVERHTGISTRVDNDSNLGALSELRFMESEQPRLPLNFVFLSIGDSGVGSGTVFDGKLYRGHDFSFASEFGHMVIDPKGEECKCGRRGCLEQYVSNRAVWKRYRPQESFERQRFLEFVWNARDGKPDAAKVLLKCGSLLSVGISNIIFALNPKMLIVAGEITEAWDIIRTPIESAIQLTKSKTEVRRARSVGELSLLQGSVCLVLNDVFALTTLGERIEG